MSITESLVKYLTQDNRATIRPCFVTCEEYPRVFLLQEEVEEYCAEANMVIGEGIREMTYRLCALPYNTFLVDILKKVVLEHGLVLTQEELAQARNIGVLPYDC